MKIRIDETTYEGPATEIMESLRLLTFNPDDFPDTDSYIRQLQGNFTRSTDMECELPESGVEERARAMFEQLARIGGLETLDDG